MAFSTSSDPEAEIQKLHKQLAVLEDEKAEREKELREIVEKIAEVKRAEDFYQRQLAAPVTSSATSNDVKGGGSSWNVRSWHWEEKGLKRWAEERITAHLVGFEHVDKATGYTLKIVSITTPISGDGAYINVRKGKKIAGFEFKPLKGKWEGRNEEGEVEVTGTFTIKDFSNDVDDDDDIEFDLTASKGGGKYKNVMRKKCMPLAIKQLCTFKTEIMKLRDSM